MDTFNLQILTPEKEYPVRHAISVNVPASTGRLGVLAHHERLVCSLVEGPMRITDTNGEETWAIGPGTMTVDQNEVTILVLKASTEQP